LKLSKAPGYNSQYFTQYLQKDGEDGVIPTNWIKGNRVYWPTVVDASKALKE